MKTILISTFFLLVTIFLQGQSLTHFTFTPQVKKAYDKTLGLRLQESRNLVAQIKIEDSQNLIVYLIEDYIDFFTVFIHENKVEFKRLLANKDRRLKIIQQGNPTSPYYLYAQADIRLHWALLHLRFEEYYAAFSEVNKAFKILNKNRVIFPNFKPNLKDLGILHAAVGTIPDEYKWGITLLTSLEGDSQQGRAEIEELLVYAEQNDFPFEVETKVLYSFLLLHLENEKDKAWKVIDSDVLRPATNPLHCFVKANIAMRTERNDIAICLLEDQPKGRAFLSMPYLDFMLGLAKLRRLDADAAPYFKSYLSKFEGIHFIKEAWQKLAWNELLKGNPAGYKKYMQNCLSFGDSTAGGDKNALKEAKSKTLPNLTLLKARLLFDGAYFEKAYKLLAEKAITDFVLKQEKLEYTYRLGRILHGMERYDEAILQYQKTIENGKKEPWFYACNAALQMAQIYEIQGKVNTAKRYFKLCLSIYPEEYKTGLHQQAKAGLARLKN